MKASKINANVGRFPIRLLTRTIFPLITMNSTEDKILSKKKKEKNMTCISHNKAHNKLQTCSFLKSKIFYQSKIYGNSS